MVSSQQYWSVTELDSTIIYQSSENMTSETSFAGYGRAHTGSTRILFAISGICICIIFLGIQQQIHR